MAKATTVQRHLTAIFRGAVDRTNVIGLRKLVNASERMAGGWSVSDWVARNVDEFHALNVEATLERCKPLVIGELGNTGRALLQSKRYAKRLAPYAEAIAAISHFRLVRFDRIGRRGEYGVPVYAVYTVGQDMGFNVGQDRPAFHFRNIPWQSGGNGPEIVGAEYTEEN